MKLKRIVIVAAVAGLAAGLYYLYGGHETPKGQQPLATLTLPPLREAFNAASSDVRVILMLSPT